MSGPASAFAAETAATIAAFGPHALVSDSNLFGSVIAAEAAQLPVAVLIPNIWELPTPGTGGSGVAPPSRHRVLKVGLRDVNAARAGYGLGPLASFYDQILQADRILVLSSEAFDSASPFVPDNVRYVGPVLDDPVWVDPWISPWPEGNTDPLVLVGFSSVYQDQGALLQRVIDALSGLEVRGVVAVGQMIEPSELTATANVTVVASAPHRVLLEEATAVVSHCGHGTTMKTLSAGVPMVCIPMGRDQDATAAQVVRQGAGVRLLPTATSAEIGLAVRDVLDDEGYRDNAVRMASIIAEEHQPLDVVLGLEELVGLVPTDAA